MERAEYWLKTWSDPKWVRDQRSAQLDMATRLMDFIPEEATVLEIGCGDGKAAELLELHGHRVTTVDLVDIPGVVEPDIVAAFPSGVFPDCDVFFTCDMLQCLHEHEVVPALTTLQRIVSAGGMIVVAKGSRVYGGDEQNHTVKGRTWWTETLREVWGNEVHVLEASNYRVAYLVGLAAPA